MSRRVFAVLAVAFMMTLAGCRQSEAVASESEQILPVESFDTEHMFLLEQMEHQFEAGGEEDTIALYTSAQVASDGQMGWDTGDQWTLLLRQETRSCVRYDEYVQYGEVQFWVSCLNPEEIPGLESTDLEQHIYVMVTTDVGFTLYDYRWDAENACFWKSVAFQPDHPWITQHSNKYSVPPLWGAVPDPESGLA